MVHAMKLNPKPFKAIASGEKIYELRLYDEKRQEVKVGDTIVFTNLGNTDETITVTVLCLHLFKNFEQLYQSLPLERCGYTEEELATASPRDMEAYYSVEEQSRYGVVAIEIALND